MAKISARGAYKIGEARKTVPPGTYANSDIPHDGWESIVVLCSDGRMLSRHVTEGYGGRKINSGYNVVRKFGKETMRASFTSWCERTGHGPIKWC